VDARPLPAYDQVSTHPGIYSRGLTMSKVLPLLAGVLLAAPSLYADEAEEMAVASVTKLGGRVQRDDKNPSHPVVGLDLSRSKVTDACLKELANLKHLQTLNLNGTPVTDASLKELANLEELVLRTSWGKISP
jgi:hypothetical protein